MHFLGTLADGCRILDLTASAPLPLFPLPVYADDPEHIFTRSNTGFIGLALTALAVAALRKKK